MNERIEQIIAAARRRPLEIVQRFNVVNGERAGEYFVQMMRDGTTVGKRFATRQAALDSQADYQSREDAEFRVELEKMTAAQMIAQVACWIK